MPQAERTYSLATVLGILRRTIGRQHESDLVALAAIDASAARRAADSVAFASGVPTNRQAETMRRHRPAVFLEGSVGNSEIAVVEPASNRAKDDAMLAHVLPRSKALLQTADLVF